MDQKTSNPVIFLVCPCNNGTIRQSSHYVGCPRGLPCLHCCSLPDNERVKHDGEKKNCRCMAFNHGHKIDCHYIRSCNECSP